MIMEKNFVIAGFGGQGVLLAGEVLANAFMLANKYVTWYPCYGAEMRGGTVNCEIVVNDSEDVSAVNKKEADFVIALILIIGVPIGLSEIIDYRKKKKD